MLVHLLFKFLYAIGNEFVIKDGCDNADHDCRERRDETTYYYCVQCVAPRMNEKRADSSALWLIVAI